MGLHWKRVTMLFVALTLMMGLFLSPVCTYGTVPAVNEKATISYQDVLTGSDGEQYFRDGWQTSLGYRQDGSTYTFLHENYDGPRRHYLLSLDGGPGYYGYCIQQGADFTEGESYQSRNAENDAYFANLPQQIKNGMMLTTLFGRQPGSLVPVPGCNGDDWYWATQVILWEYQQQLRKSPTKLEGNGHVPRDYFKETLNGRPARKCYDWMLDQMAKHISVPRFASKSPETADVLLMKRESVLLPYTLHLDTEDVPRAEGTKGPGIEINPGQRGIWLVSEREMEETLLTFQKTDSAPKYPLLVWGSGNENQAMVTGTYDPFRYYVKVRSEKQGHFTVKKTSEDGLLSGFQFTVTSESGDVFTGKTGEDGIWEIDLDPGNYTISEEPAAGYQPNPQESFAVAEGEETVYEVFNELKRYKLSIRKVDEMTGDPVRQEGILFEVNGIRYATDSNGMVQIDDLLPGAYEIIEIKGPEGYLKSGLPRHVTIEKGGPELVTFEFGNQPEPVTPRVPDTSDTSPLLPWISCLLSALAIFLIKVQRPRRF